MLENEYANIIFSVHIIILHTCETFHIFCVTSNLQPFWLRNERRKYENWTNCFMSVEYFTFANARTDNVYRQRQELFNCSARRWGCAQTSDVAEFRQVTSWRRLCPSSALVLQQRTCTDIHFHWRDAPCFVYTFSRNSTQVRKTPRTSH